MTILSPSTPLSVTTHKVELPLGLRGLAAGGNVEPLERLLYQVASAGDRQAMLAITTAVVDYPAAHHVGVSRATLLGYAAGAWVGAMPMTVADLARTADELAGALSMVEIGLGFDRPSQLKGSFDQAHRIVASAIEAFRQAARGRIHSGQIVAAASQLGLLPLAEALAKASAQGSTGSTAAQVKFAAILRHSFSDPYRAAQIAHDIVQWDRMNPCAWNQLAGNLGDQAERASDPSAYTELRRSALEAAMMGMRLRADGYAGRTMRRAAREAGHAETARLADRVDMCWEAGQHDEATCIAGLILARLGDRAGAELQFVRAGRAGREARTLAFRQTADASAFAGTT